jgi:hypothetical protein
MTVNRGRRCRLINEPMAWAGVLACVGLVGGQAAPADSPAAAARLVARYCHDCHAGEAAEADIDLAAFAAAGDLERRTKLWQRVGRVLAEGDMPPRDSEQPTAAERESLFGFVQESLAAEAAKQAGDPGRVVLRRLSNAEYTFTVRDLTGLATLDPAREFPVDGAAGEGFTNTGQALVMSPALVTKYLDAAKGIAAHAVLVPDGLRFSPSVERGDQIEEALGRLRAFFGRFTAPRDDISAVVGQGIQLDAGHEGFVPLDRYLLALEQARDAIRGDQAELARVARDRGLSAKYLAALWHALEADAAGESLLLDRLRTGWRAGDSAAALTAEVRRWQDRLWKFNKIGLAARHVGRPKGPAAWLEPLCPLSASLELRIPLPAGSGRRLALAAGDAGDGADDDAVVWEKARLAVPGSADVPLGDAVRGARQRDAARPVVAATAVRCLEVLDTLARDPADLPGDAAGWDEAARAQGIDPRTLAAWGTYLGLQAHTPGIHACGELLATSNPMVGGHEGVTGWTAADALLVVANATVVEQKIPGTIPPGGVAVHPAPKRQVVVAWRAPAAGRYGVESSVVDRHVGCGNGVAWSLELRRGGMRLPLAGGTANEKQEPRTFASPAPLPLLPGDMLCLVVGPKDGDHGCDLTGVDLRITAGEQRWDLAADVAGSLAAANPHPDSQGHAGVWHFASEPTVAASAATVPAGSALARWLLAGEPAGRQAAAAEVALVLASPPPPADSPDSLLHRQLLGISSPLVAAAAVGLGADAADSSLPFGLTLDGLSVAAGDLATRAPATIELPLPDDLVGEIVVTARIHPGAGPEATAQVHAAILTGEAKPEGIPGLAAERPFLARPDTAGWDRIARSLADHQQLLPPAVCYGRVVPVDEIVTFNLYYREDDRLRALMLDTPEAATLDRLWDELLWVSREPLEIVDVYEQLLEYASQDAGPLLAAFQPVGPVLAARAQAFRHRLADAEPAQVDAVIGLAARAFRRPLAAAEAGRLRAIYGTFRREGLDHEAAVRLLLARVLVAPEFLYKIENPGPGREAAAVSDYELACRLSYFLWSSLPDEELAHEAAAGRLHEPAVLTGQLRRMVADPKIRRLAEQFGTYWLHVENFAEHDEKSPQAFPEFADLRGAMHEEAVLLLVDLFERDRPIGGLLDADYAFLNEQLAAFYGIPGVAGPEWRLVEGVREHGRGGVLTLAAALAKQSGASRTSPILRGTWITEVLLGQRVPKPPQGVPPLAEAPPAGLSERELTALHSRDAACASCHARFDAYGFALEAFDAIGRRRELDAAGKPVDTAATLPDGTPVAGHADLARHLAAARGAAFGRQFCKKLLGYALGRETQLSDLPLLEAIDERLQAADGRVMAALEAIVTSPQFLEIRGGEADDDE